MVSWGPPERGAITIYTVTYVEVRPRSRADAVLLVTRYRETTRTEDGNLRSEVLTRIGQPHQFAMLEAWTDQAAFDAHAASTGATRLRDGLQAIRIAPLDCRAHVGVSVGPLGREAGGTVVWVATHVDVVPPRKDEGLAALAALAEASRGAPGNLRFEVVQQINRPNHFTVIEIWKDAAALENRATAEATRRFRDALGPMSGALYDERLFTALG